jgi:hypothetical protein
MRSRDEVHCGAYQNASLRASEPWVGSGTSGVIAASAAWYVPSWFFTFTRLESWLLAIMAFLVVWGVVFFFEQKFWAIYHEEFKKIHFGDG